MLGQVGGRTANLAAPLDPGYPAPLAAADSFAKVAPTLVLISHRAPRTLVSPLTLALSPPRYAFDTPRVKALSPSLVLAPAPELRTPLPQLRPTPPPQQPPAPRQAYT